MVADILTKPLPGWKVKVHTAALGLRSACGVKALQGLGMLDVSV